MALMGTQEAVVGKKWMEGRGRHKEDWGEKFSF